MSKEKSLQQVLNTALKSPPSETTESTEPRRAVAERPTAAPKRRVPSSKEHVGGHMNADFNTSLRMIQLKKRRDEHGNRVHIVDLLAEALNDLFRKHDVPTVFHE